MKIGSPPTFDLASELAWYDQHEAELVEKFSGKFVLLRGGRVCAAGESEDQLFAEATDLGFGEEGFLIMWVGELPAGREGLVGV